MAAQLRQAINWKTIKMCSPFCLRKQKLLLSSGKHGTFTSKKH
ncbi:hypothetical protein MCHI_000929 [Candidatus Magnetoovum chiemensis]|nr:hypothetical protein MCHI_000929 [Candidatus Magnetoovum chiemensis]